MAKLSDREAWAAKTGKSKYEYKNSSDYKAKQARENKEESVKEMKKYQERILEALKPTQAETELGTQVSNVEQSRDTGIQQIKEKPIEMTSILGQSRNVEDRAAQEIGTLEQRLGRLQQQREANLQALSTALGFASDDVSRYTQAGQYQDQRADSALAMAEDTRRWEAGMALDRQREARIGGGSGNSKITDLSDMEVRLATEDAIKEAESQGLYGNYAWEYAQNELRKEGVDVGDESAFQKHMRAIFGIN